MEIEAEKDLQNDDAHVRMMYFSKGHIEKQSEMYANQFSNVAETQIHTSHFLTGQSQQRIELELKNKRDFEKMIEPKYVEFLKSDEKKFFACQEGVKSHFENSLALISEYKENKDIEIRNFVNDIARLYEENKTGEELNQRNSVTFQKKWKLENNIESLKKQVKDELSNRLVRFSVSEVHHDHNLTEEIHEKLERENIFDIDFTKKE